MQVKSDGAEIDRARQMKVYGEWVRFKDGDGAAVKMPPYLIKQLYDFAVAHKDEFYPGAWESGDK